MRSRRSSVYRRSADLGNLEGMTSLAVMLVYGKGTAKDEAEAVRLLRVAAEGGHARASYVLGILALQGQGGLAKDSAEAARLFRTAANLGNTSAMAELASMLQAGDGGPANPDEAAAWMYRALTLGDAFAYQQMRKNAAAWSLPFRKAFQRVMQQNGKYSGPLYGKFGSTTFAAIDALAKPN